MAFAATVVFVAWSLANQQAVGVVSGIVYLPSGHPAGKGVRVRVTCDDEERDGKTDAGGWFRITDVPTGGCSLSAEAEHHSASLKSVQVKEGRETHVTVRLQRTEDWFGLRIADKQWRPGSEGAVTLQGFLPPSGASEPARIEVIRLHPQALLRVAAEHGLLYVLDDSGDYDRQARPADSVGPVVRSVLHTPVANDWEGFFSQLVHIGALDRGVYVVRARYRTWKVSHVLIVTDITLVTQTDAWKTVAFVVHRDTGKAVKGARVWVHGSDRVYTTDARGMATVPLSPRKDKLIVGASLGGSFALCETSVPRSGSEPVVALYTDRPVYRPGQTVHFKGIVRIPRQTGYEVPPAMRLWARLEDEAGVVHGKTECRTDSYGCFSGAVSMNSEASTGEAALFIRGAKLRHVTTVQVVAYRKPELEVTVKPLRSRYFVNDTAEFDISLSYFYGAPAAGARVSYDVWREPNLNADTSLAVHMGALSGPYMFDASRIEGELRTDSQGRCRLRIPLRVKPGEAPSAFVLHVQAFGSTDDGSNGGGDASVAVHPGAALVTVRPGVYVSPLGSSVWLEAVITGLDGRRLPGRHVQFTAARLIGNDQTPKRVRVLSVTAVTDQWGIARTQFVPERPGEYELVATVEDDEGRTVSGEDWLWVPGERAEQEKDYPDLTLVPFKPSCRAGETARFLLRSSFVGASALITVATTNLTKCWTVELTSRTTTITLPLPVSRGQRVWVSACAVRRGRLASDTARVVVADENRKVRLVLQPGRQAYRPGDTAVLRLKSFDTKGRPISADASIAVVDEALYGVREDYPELLENAFYSAESSNVYEASSCFYSELLDSSGAGPKGLDESKLRRRFLDVAFWRATVRTDKQGKAVVRFRLPDNITSWRATARAVTLDTRVGYARTNVATRLPFHIRLDAPRFVLAGDVAGVTAVLRNGTSRNLTGRLTLVCQEQRARLQDPAQQPFSLKPLSTGTVTWRILAGRPGTLALRVVGRTSDDALTDATEIALPIKPRFRERIWTAAGTIRGSASYEVQIAPEAGDSPSLVGLRLTPTALAAIGPGLDYLLTYPYGCTEQTVSSFLPDLLVARLLRNVAPESAAAIRRAVGNDKVRQVPAMVQAGIARLARMHGMDGWGWWEGGSADPWLTAYATWALGEAWRDGYAVPEGLAYHAVTACQRMRTSRETEPDAVAFLTLAIAAFGYGSKITPPLARMSAAGLAMTVLAEERLRKRSAYGDAALARLMRMANRTGVLVYWEAPPKAYEYSDELVTALAVRAILLRRPHAPEVEGALRYLMMRRTDNYWRSTRDTAFVLMALVDYARTVRPSFQVPRRVSLRINGTLVHRFSFDAHADPASERVIRLRTSALRPGRNRVELVSEGSGAPFFAVTVRGVLAGETGRSAARRGDIQITRRYEVFAGGLAMRRGWRSLDPGSEIQAGAVIRVKLTARVKKELPFALLIDPLPGGFEPVSRGANESPEDQDMNHIDIRDDHVAVFASVLSPGEHQVEYFVRAQRPGRYLALPSRLECMYAPETWAESRAVLVTVR